MARNELEAAKREFAKPVLKKGPVTPEMIFKICKTFAGTDAILSDPRFAAICVTTYGAFLYYKKLASLRCFEASAILLLGFTYLRAKQGFIGIAPMFCWRNQRLCFLPFSRT